MSKTKIIGIDLGTTNSCVSVYEGSDPVVIANAEGKRTTPSVVGFTKEGERKVGDPAKRQAVTNPKNTVYSIKRFMGCDYESVKNEAEKVAYSVVNDANKPKVDIDGTKYTPQEISAMILSKMKKTAEDYLGTEVTEAVITVPAYFNDTQRQATIEAGKIAGLEVKRIVNEPTAAALAYGINKGDKDMKVVVFDCGGGTHDVSILEFGGGVFEVLSTAGDTHLGGDDIDNILINWLVETFKSDTGMDLSKDPMAMQRLKEAAEKAKIELSSSNATDINLPYITVLDGVPQHLTQNITRAKFDQLINDIVKRTIEPCRKALEDAKLTVNDIDEILLVGGSTRIPAIQNAVKDFFGKEPSKGVNPDEVVSVGAAVQGAILNEEEGVGDIVLLDVNPISIGIEAHNQFDPQGHMAKLIEANTTIPCKKSQVFTTAVDNQPGVQIVILQGERTYAKDCKTLGTFMLDGIAPAKAGVPQIEVTFDVDANGVLNVSAKDLATGKEQKITIENSSLSDEEIERMKADADAHKEEDAKREEQMNKLNAVQSYVNMVKTTILDGELAAKLTDDEKKNISELNESLENKLKDWESTEDKDVFIADAEKDKQAIEALVQPIMARLYAENAPKDEQGNPTTAGNPFGGAPGANPFADGMMDMFNGTQTA